MSFTVFLGNLPAWVTADDIRGWLAAENLVADAIKVIRNPETQESKGFAFIEAPNTDEMNAIIRRFDRAPLEERLLRANPAQPPRPKSQTRPPGGPGNTGGHSGGSSGPQSSPPTASQSAPPASSHGNAPANIDQRPPRRGKRSGGKKPANGGGSNSAFAEELAKAL
ncbi:MAG TPA: RNA-binding protein [Bryobacteraceae bacterium]|jgi:RNA recognition motif-containing protein|nr:RNA-binding protein [Bryobacteraceae bacterium]